MLSPAGLAKPAGLRPGFVHTQIFRQEKIFWTPTYAKALLGCKGIKWSSGFVATVCLFDPVLLR